MFTDTFAGISPASLPGFIAAQLVGAAIGVALAVALFPQTPDIPAASAPAEPPAEARVPAGSTP